MLYRSGSGPADPLDRGSTTFYSPISLPFFCMQSLPTPPIASFKRGTCTGNRNPPRNVLRLTSEDPAITNAVLPTLCASDKYPLQRLKGNIDRKSIRTFTPWLARLPVSSLYLSNYES